jgi:acyl-CoA thioesterase-1
MRWMLFIFLISTSGVEAKTILFLGDSLTEGYQLAKEDAFPAVIERNLKPRFPDIKVINGGVSGATTASGLKRLNWYVKAKPEIMVLALGANDGLRGLNLKESEKNLSAVIQKAKDSGMSVLLVGMKMPTNYGEPYRTNFEKLFPKLAKKYQLPLVPFLLEDVGGNPKLNLPDGIHPNVDGHKIMAKTIQKILEPLI